MIGKHSDCSWGGKSRALDLRKAEVTNQTEFRLQFATVISVKQELDTSYADETSVLTVGGIVTLQYGGYECKLNDKYGDMPTCPTTQLQTSLLNISK